MAGPRAGYKARLMRAVHAEARRRGMSHDELRDMCHATYGIHSLSEMTDNNLFEIYHGWTGKTLRRRCNLPARGEAAKSRPGEVRLVSEDELCELAQEFAKRGLDEAQREAFIRRQLEGRPVVRTRREFCAVVAGVRAMNRRGGGGPGAGQATGDKITGATREGAVR
jgi:hypothetical protein